MTTMNERVGFFLLFPEVIIFIINMDYIHLEHKKGPKKIFN
jgi:hypothetical protein